MPVLTKGFEKSVGGIIIALTWLIDDCDEGAGKQEEVDRLIDQSAMEVPSAVDLWCNSCRPVRVCHFDNWSILWTSLATSHGCRVGIHTRNTIAK